MLEKRAVDDTGHESRPHGPGPADRGQLPTLASGTLTFMPLVQAEAQHVRMPVVGSRTMLSSDHTRIMSQCPAGVEQSADRMREANGAEH